ncbi:MAG: MraY family glycosyltransferase, partial [Sediminibacterium sp.]|nr:MraY family glycosyltransferase [Sediminibacterium sp.]
MENLYFKIIFLFFTSSFVTFLIVPLLIKILTKFKILDEPSKVKIHKVEIPSMGGLAILLAVFISVPFFIHLNELSQLRSYFFACFAMMIIGFRDDTKSLKPYQKLFGQIFIVILLIKYSDIEFKSFLYQYFENHEAAKIFLYILIGFFIIFLTNSFNVIDGIDGLACSYLILIFCCISFWCFNVNLPIYALTLLSIIGALCAFWVYNWQPARIFLGDTGSLPLGLILSTSIVIFSKFNYELPENHPFKFYNDFSMVIGLAYLPLFDAIRVIVIRFSKKKSPFKGDKNHLHHVLLSLGLNHGQSVIFLLIMNALLIAILVLLKNSNVHYSRFFIIFYSVLLSILFYKKYH